MSTVAMSTVATPLEGITPAGSTSERAVRDCPACGSRRVRIVHRLTLCTPDDHPLGSGYDVVSCLACGTGYANAEADQAFYDAYYADQAKYAAEAATRTPVGEAPENLARTAEPEWVLNRFELAADQIAAVLPDTGSRILDIGCATGNLLAALARRGYDALKGIDPSPQAAAVAVRVHGLDVEVGTFARLPSGLGDFDCICLTGVLEHLWNVDEAMSAVTGLLRPGGIVYLSVPDASRYLDPYIAPFQDFGTEHVNHFSPATFDLLARRLGFETLWSGRSDAHLGPRSPCAAMAAVWHPSAYGASGLDLGALVADRALVSSLDAFAQRSRIEMAEIERSLDERLSGAASFALWGFGEMAMKILTLPPLRDRRLVALFDGNPSRWGTRVRGLPVSPPGEVPDQDVPLVVGSLLSEDSIAGAISRRGLKNRLVLLSGGTFQ